MLQSKQTLEPRLAGLRNKLFVAGHPVNTKVTMPLCPLPLLSIVMKYLDTVRYLVIWLALALSHLISEELDEEQEVRSYSSIARQVMRRCIEMSSSTSYSAKHLETTIL